MSVDWCSVLGDYNRCQMIPNLCCVRGCVSVYTPEKDEYGVYFDLVFGPGRGIIIVI